MNTKDLDQEAMALDQRASAVPQFSPAWFEVMREIEAWTKKHGRPLVATYNE